MDMQNYIQNTRISQGRNLRLEFTGRATENEKNFLTGISFFTAATLGKNDAKHLQQVSGIMVRLIRYLSKPAPCK